MFLKEIQVVVKGKSTLAVEPIEGKNIGLDPVNNV